MTDILSFTNPSPVPSFPLLFFPYLFRLEDERENESVNDVKDVRDVLFCWNQKKYTWFKYLEESIFYL